MRVARELFTQNGYHHTTLDEIARHAEFGKGTIYNYFPSKEELFFGIIERLTEELIVLAQECSRAGDARTQLGAYANAMIAHARDNADLFTLIMREVHHLDSEKYEKKLQAVHRRARTVWETLARPIKGAIGAGSIRSSDPLWLAALFDGMVRTYCLTRYGSLALMTPHGPEDPGALIVSVFFDGVSQRQQKG